MITEATLTNGSNKNRWSSATGRTFLGLTEIQGQDKWEGPFFFSVLADTQLGALEDNRVSNNII